MAVLEVGQLDYAYDDGTVALRGVSFQLAEGERVGLIGPNGSGKSTLLMCLAGLMHGQGRIQVEGRPLDRRSAAGLRGKVGLVFQSPDDQLFMPVLSDDLAFGPINMGWPADQVQHAVNEAARRLGVDQLMDRAPHHLSMGQKRSAAIAAVLAMRPAVLLMDEPSSNLDPRSRRALIDLLTGLPTTLLLAAHDLELIGRLCSRVLLIDEGRIVVDGPASEILADAGLMHQHGLEIWRPLDEQSA